MILDNTFAAAVYEQNTIDEMIDALTRDADSYDCEQWCLTKNEYFESIIFALKCRKKGDIK